MHGTHRKWSQQERGSRRGSGSLVSFHHLLLTVPGCWVEFLLPSLEELVSAAEAGSLRDMCPDPFAAAGALHGQGHEVRAMGSLQSQSCLGTGAAQGKILPVCLLSQLCLPGAWCFLPCLLSDLPVFKGKLDLSSSGASTAWRLDFFLLDVSTAIIWCRIPSLCYQENSTEVCL